MLLASRTYFFIMGKFYATFHGSVLILQYFKDTGLFFLANRLVYPLAEVIARCTKGTIRREFGPMSVFS